jgi:hypothetical protein
MSQCCLRKIYFYKRTSPSQHANMSLVTKELYMPNMDNDNALYGLADLHDGTQMSDCPLPCSTISFETQTITKRKSQNGFSMISCFSIKISWLQLQTSSLLIFLLSYPRLEEVWDSGLDWECCRLLNLYLHFILNVNDQSCGLK